MNYIGLLCGSVHKKSVKYVKQMSGCSYVASGRTENAGGVVRAGFLLRGSGRQLPQDIISLYSFLNISGSVPV
jgi:hypothetical protein